MDQESQEVGSLHGLPDLAQENTAVSDWLIANDRRWLREVRPQGYRLDAVKHVPAEFWKRYSAAMHEEGGENFLLLGEVFRGVPAYVARYQREDGIDAVFDVPLADAVRDTLTHDSEDPAPGFVARMLHVAKNHKHMLWNEILRKVFPRDPGDMRNLSKVFASDGEYERPDLLATVIDNHDMARFVGEAGEGGREKLRMALALLMTARGIPVLLYGTESGMDGQSGGPNRADMEFGADPEMAAWVKTLTGLRKDHVALRRGKQVEVAADREIYCFARIHDRDTVLVALNNSREPQTRMLDVADLIPEGAVLEDLVGPERAVCRDGRIRVAMEPHQALILRVPRR